MTTSSHSSTSDRTVRLFHGTTTDAAQGIVTDGFTQFDPTDAVDQVARQHGHSPAEVWRVLESDAGFWLTRGIRGADASFALQFDIAAHSWAQRAPEFRREALWAVWLLDHPDHDRPWTQHAAGHLWVNAHLSLQAPVVLEVQVSVEELLEWSASAVMNGRPLPLDSQNVSFLLRPGIPEIAIPTTLWFPPEDFTQHHVQRRVEWEEFALLLGMGTDEFIAASNAGEFGPKGVGQSSHPLAQATVRYPKEQVETVLSQRRTGVSYLGQCPCLQ